MKCDACGLESDFEAAFFKQRKAFRKSVRNLCPACRGRRRRISNSWLLILILLAGIIGYAILWFEPWSLAGYYLTTFFLVEVFLILTIVPHELGHAIVGWLVGWRVFAIIVGMGKQILKFRLFGVLFVFNLLPFNGLTRLAPVDARWYRTKRFLMVLAGPAVNAAFVAIILAIWWTPWREYGFFWGLPRAARICVWANFWVMAYNLWPQRLKSGRDSDGMQLFKTFSKNDKDVENAVAARFALEALIRRDEFKDYYGALDWCNRGLVLFPQDFTLLSVSGVLCLDAKDYARAREIFLQLLPGENKPNEKRYLILNNIAYTDALIGGHELLAEADAYSKEAYDNAPWAAYILGTRGTVLVELGQLEPGIKLLKEAFEKHTGERNKALNACHLAIAWFRTGDRKEAENYLQLGRQLDPECSLLERAESELNGGPSALRVSG